jgi:hypothetical protein
VARGYVNQILQLYDEAIEALVEDGISREVIDFRARYQKPRRPTRAFSEFLINKEMGDWAETLVQTEINHRLRGFQAVKYGRAGHIIAGDPSFPQFFDDYHAELANNGKRPDLLIFRDEVWREVGKEVNYQNNISTRINQSFEFFRFFAMDFHFDIGYIFFEVEIHTITNRIWMGTLRCLL